ncbi:unnamed protein product [Rhizopus stolonifer]
MTLSANLTLDESSDISAHNDRRSAHNALERQRREHLNLKFQQLAHALPSLQAIRRPSKATIVSRSLEFVSSSLKRESDFMSEIETLRLENAKLKKQAEQASANLKKNETEQLSPPPTPKSLKEPKKRSRQEEEERPQKKKMVRQEREKSNYLNMTPFMPSPLADNIIPENLLMNMYDPSYMMNPFMSTFYNPDQLFNDQVNFLS